MIVSVDNCAPIIERLLMALVDDKRSVELNANCLPGRINWLFRVNINDTGKVIGKGGSHLRALQLIVRQIGRAAGEEWTANPLDPTGDKREGQAGSALTPKTHSNREDRELLCELLTALQIQAEVLSAGTVKDGFVFKIEAAGQQHLAALLESHKVDYKLNGEMMVEEANLQGALGSLFRAIARRQGVRYRLTTED